MLRFIEDKHLYLHDSGKAYTSVTRLLHKLEPEKDWDKIASNYAKKNKLKVEDVKHMWKQENLKSVNRGNKFHKLMEDTLCRKLSVNVDGHDLVVNVTKTVDGVKLAKSLKLEPGIYPELIIYLDSIEVAGQADYVEVVDGKINIKDYKTNKEIKTSGFKDWKGVEEKFKAPLSHLGNCNYNLYCLQLNMYMYMLLKHNPKLKIGKMELLHIKFDEDDDPIDQVVYRVPNMQKEIKNLVAYWDKTRT